jgi:hypothetical protein
MRFGEAVEEEAAFVAGEAEEESMGDAEGVEAGAMAVPDDEGGEEVDDFELTVPKEGAGGGEI